MTTTRFVLALVAAPVAIPVLGLLAVSWRCPQRLGTWYWRWWWFYGYHFGLYRLDWARKRRRRARLAL